MLLNPEFTEQNVQICTYPVFHCNAEHFDKVRAGITDDSCALTYSSIVAPLDGTNNDKPIKLSCDTHFGYMNLAIKRGTFDQIYSFDVHNGDLNNAFNARKFKEVYQQRQYSVQVFRYTNEDTAKLENLLDSTVSKEMKLEVMKKHHSALFTFDGLNTTDPDSHEIVAIVALSKIQQDLLHLSKKVAKSFGLIYVAHPTYKIIPTHKFSVNKDPLIGVKYDTTITTMEENERYYFLFDPYPSLADTCDVWDKFKLKEYKVCGEIKIPSQCMWRVNQTTNFPFEFGYTALKQSELYVNGDLPLASNVHYTHCRKLSTQPGEACDYKFLPGRLQKNISRCGDQNNGRLMFKTLKINKCSLKTRAYGKDIIVQEEKEPLRLSAKTIARTAKRNEKCSRSQILYDSPNDKFGNVYQSIVGQHVEVMRLIDKMDAQKKFVETKYKKALPTNTDSEYIHNIMVLRRMKSGVVNAADVEQAKSGQKPPLIFLGSKEENPITSKYAACKKIPKTYSSGEPISDVPEKEDKKDDQAQAPVETTPMETTPAASVETPAAAPDVTIIEPFIKRDEEIVTLYEWLIEQETPHVLKFASLDDEFDFYSYIVTQKSSPNIQTLIEKWFIEMKETMVQQMVNSKRPLSETIANDDLLEPPCPKRQKV